MIAVLGRERIEVPFLSTDGYEREIIHYSRISGNDAARGIECENMFRDRMRIEDIGAVKIVECADLQKDVHNFVVSRAEFMKE